MATITQRLYSYWRDKKKNGDTSGSPKRSAASGSDGKERGREGKEAVDEGKQADCTPSSASASRDRHCNPYEGKESQTESESRPKMHRATSYEANDVVVSSGSASEYGMNSDYAVDSFQHGHRNSSAATSARESLDGDPKQEQLAEEAMRSLKRM